MFRYIALAVGMILSLIGGALKFLGDEIEKRVKR